MLAGVQISMKALLSEISLCTFTPLWPERGIQLSVGQKTGLQAGEESQQVPSFGEVNGGSLYPILTHQHDGTPTVSCKTRQVTLWWYIISYIRLFIVMFFSGNSTLKCCIKSMWGNFSQNPNDRLNLPERMCQIYANTYFMNFDTLVNLVKMHVYQKHLMNST